MSFMQVVAFFVKFFKANFKPQFAVFVENFWRLQEWLNIAFVDWVHASRNSKQRTLTQNSDNLVFAFSSGQFSSPT